MTFFIEDGTGKGFSVKVNENNRAYNDSVQQNKADFAASIGDAYNINTGDIWISGLGSSAIAYLKNNEDRNLIVDAIAVGVGTSPGITFAGTPTLKLLRNPTAGTLIDNTLAVAQNQNRNFGSSKTLTADAYAGSNSYTLTGGNEIAQFYQSSNGRLFADIGFELTKGDSIGMYVDSKLTAGSFFCYAAWIAHLRDAKE